MNKDLLESLGKLILSIIVVITLKYKFNSPDYISYSVAAIIFCLVSIECRLVKIRNKSSTKTTDKIYNLFIEKFPGKDIKKKYAKYGCIQFIIYDSQLFDSEEFLNFLDYISNFMTDDEYMHIDFTLGYKEIN